ncbi:MAG TPA: PhzF family phenazine biosynthesis protein, partial [Telmatospirillum sp.]|nr:PhzF family phenazine biosynthesis protein [Telmatospirillum sp.]
PDQTLAAIAAENNLSETAFVVPRGEDFDLRWFTPTVEVDLCGHATLATAHLALTLWEPGRQTVAFHTKKAGILTVERQGDLLSMDFPARPPSVIAPPAGLSEALGKPPVAVLKSRDIMAVYDTAEDVATLTPDLAAVGALDAWAVIVTAPGDHGIDFVSRFFAPGHGVPEDPVTGSAHCTLVPYWAERLGKASLEARQLSKRGGALTCRLAGDRVAITGRAVLYFEGRITI